MRVLFFGETPHRLAGAQRSLLAALTRLSAHGVEPLVLFPGPGIVEQTYRAAGIPTRLLDAPASLLLFNKRLLALGTRARVRMLVREHLPYTLRLARFMRDEGFAAVHCNTARGILVAGPAAKLARRPTVLHLRGSANGIGRSYWTAAQLLADRIVLVARAIEPSVWRPFRGRCRVVYNGVLEQPARDRVAARRALAGRLGLPALANRDATLFVSLSSLTPFKGLHHLLVAASALRKRGVEACYLLASVDAEAWYERYLLELRSALGLDDIVHLLGFDADPLGLLAAADVAVLPSVEHERLDLGKRVIDVRGTEGLPRSILEAMSLAVPVVASRVEGVVEQIEDGATGVIVPPGDPAALADALAGAAADPAWREAAGRRGREQVRKRFSVEASAVGLAAVLRELVGAAGAQ